MNTLNFLNELSLSLSLDSTTMLFPNADIDEAKIQVIMINEVPPQNPEDWFYCRSGNPDYMKTTLSLFRKAGISVKNIEDILNLGIYITTAVKNPKIGYTVDTSIIKAQLPLLEAELELFPNLKDIMLMGDVAKKSLNMIVKSRTKKNLIPSEATYKIRSNEFYWNSIRVFPSYIMTGGNILIEKSKCEMISEDIKHMMAYIKGVY